MTVAAEGTPDHSQFAVGFGQNVLMVARPRQVLRDDNSQVPSIAGSTRNILTLHGVNMDPLYTDACNLIHLSMVTRIVFPFYGTFS